MDKTERDFGTPEEETSIEAGRRKPVEIEKHAQKGRMFGKYELFEELGRGGMSIVYRARDQELGREVAFKVIIGGGGATEEQIARFHREAEAIAHLHHPNIISIYDVGIEEHQRYFTMDLIDGCSLAELISFFRRGTTTKIGTGLQNMIAGIAGERSRSSKETDRVNAEKQSDRQPLQELKKEQASDSRPSQVVGLPINEALTLMQKISSGITHAHQKGMIHRDLKPGNIMLTRDGEPVVLDFGLARNVKGSIALTRTGQIFGTPAYMAPEQVTGSVKDVDERSDIYSLGATFYEMLTGDAPLESTGRLADDLARIATHEPTPLRKVNPRIPREVAIICEKAMEKEKSRRYPSTKAFADDIGRYLGGEPVLARPVSRTYRMRKFVHRNPWQVATTIVVLVSLLTVLGFWGLNRLKQYATWGTGIDITPQSSKELESKWHAIGGIWEVKDGKLVAKQSPSKSFVLLYNQPAQHANIAVEFDAMAERKDPLKIEESGDLTIILASDSEHRTRYSLQAGGWGNSVAMIQRKKVSVASVPFRVEPGRIYHIRAEKEGEWLRLFCDGKLLVSYQDIFYLEGDYFGLYTWGAGKKFWNIRVYQRGVPELVSPLAAGDEFFRKSMSTEGQIRNEYLKSALDTYTRVHESQREHELGLKALLKMAYVKIELGEIRSAKKDLEQLKEKTSSLELPLLKGEIAFREENLQVAYETYRKAIRDYPANSIRIVGRLRSQLSKDVAKGMDEELRMKFWRVYAENSASPVFECSKSWLSSLEFLKGLTFSKVLCEHNQITSLEPLRGMPLTLLDCRDNQITSLEPLRGMPLTMLACGHNQVRSLEPLRGMPLTWLGCEDNQITGLEPLRGMPLTWLDCQETRIRSLELLRGMPLTYLNCGGNQVASLEPLRGMPLTRLDCWGNQITSLEPLRGMLLTLLDCWDNQITSLEPLRGMPLTSLVCPDNQIRSLEPLRGMPLTGLNCRGNQVASLEPLRGMPLTWLDCRGNQIKSLEPFAENPPEIFWFDCKTLPDEELERCIAIWSGNPSNAHHARNARILLALRRNEYEKIKLLAESFRDHLYLLIPKLLGWEDARELCRELGGHLVTITSAEENEFLKQVTHKQVISWIGLVRNEGKAAWVTGEALKYKGYPNILAEREDGYTRYRGGKWRTIAPGPSPTGIPFIIEWEP